MGCTKEVNNTIVMNNNTIVMNNIKRFKDAIKEVKLIQNDFDLKDDYSLNCFLISIKSIPNFYEIILKNINDETNISEDLKNYKLEENIKIYDDIINNVKIF